MATYSNERAGLQLLEAAGRQPTATKRARLQLLEAVGWQPTAIKGLGCSYLEVQVGNLQQ